MVDFANTILKEKLAAMTAGMDDIKGNYTKSGSEASRAVRENGKGSNAYQFVAKENEDLAG